MSSSLLSLSALLTLISLTTIPDNKVVTLTYTDPTTKESKTCTDSCPLVASSTALYQDFLFNASQQITGFQLRLTGWSGSGPGLHVLQLLSIGAFANAVQSLNSVSCYAPAASEVSTTGTWTSAETITTIPGTTQNVLVATVPINSSASAGPTLTWSPYVSASGQYEVYFMIPGCTNLQDCSARTSVQVTVNPGGGVSPVVTNVSERVSDDTQTLIYRGPVIPAAPDYRVSVSLQMSSSPEGSGSGGRYSLVADRVQFVLTSVDISGNGNTNSTAGSGVGRSGFGFFEWPLSAQGVNATGVISNSSQTPFEALAFAVPNANANVRALASQSSTKLFAGGNFTTASAGSNIVSVDGSGSGAVNALAGQGLNGAVAALVISGNTLFVGGEFTDTRAGGASGLRYVAQYDINSNSWSSLGSGLAFPVSSLQVSDTHLLVGGEFGLARWDIANSAWVGTGGYVSGSTTFIGDSSAAGNDATVLGGSFGAVTKYGADGWAILENGPTVKPLGALLDHTGSTSGSTSSASSTSTATSSAQPSATGNARVRRHWFSHVSMPQLFERQQPSASLPSLPSAAAPAVLAGAFYAQLTILGGNFTFSNGQAKNLAFYNSDSGKLSAVQGSQVEGVVRALYVRGDDLFVGGEFTVQGAKGSGLATYGLASNGWQNNDSEGLVGELLAYALFCLLLILLGSCIGVICGCPFDYWSSFERRYRYCCWVVCWCWVVDV